MPRPTRRMKYDGAVLIPNVSQTGMQVLETTLIVINRQTYNTLSRTSERASKELADSHVLNFHFETFY